LIRTEVIPKVSLSVTPCIYELNTRGYKNQ